jgi:ATP-dependent Clp protease ATP-binding subunit ClpA
VLRDLGEKIRAGAPKQIPCGADTKKTIELALREALSLGHNYIGTEHLLLSLVREGFVADGEHLRDDIVRRLRGPVKGNVTIVSGLVDTDDEKIERIAQRVAEILRAEEPSA